MASVLCVAFLAMMIVPLALTAPTTGATATVLSPWGKINPPTNTPLAARPSSLNGANVGIIYFDRLGGLEMANAIETNLKANATGLTVEMTKLNQIRLTPKETKLTQAWFDEKADSYDAVVIDVADTTNTAYWASVYVREFESRGVPAVVLTTSNFTPVLKVSAEAHGITALRSVEIPNDVYAQAFRDMTARSAALIESGGYGASLRAKLTTALTAVEKAPAPIIAPHQEDEYEIKAASVEELPETFLDFSMQEGFGDGLPLTMPTKEAVDAMLTGTVRSSDEVLGTLRLRYGIMTVEKVAINAVMAGADPKYFPVILAAMEAVIDGIEDDSLFHYAWTSGDDYSLMILVNGPIAKELDFYADRSFTQTARDAQLTIGRSVRLSFQNIGHNTKRDVNTGRTGAVADHAGSVMTENVIQFPGSINPAVYKWEPHHVTMGFKEQDSVVTIAASGRWAEMQNTVPGWFTQEINGYLVMPGHFMLRDNRPHDYPIGGSMVSMSNSQGYGTSTFESLPVNPKPSRDWTMITYNPDNISNLLEAPETNNGLSTGEVDLGRAIPNNANLTVKLGLGNKQAIKDWFTTHGLQAGQRTGPGASGSFLPNMSNVQNPAIPFAAHANVVQPIVSGEHPAYARVIQTKFLGMDAARSQLVTGAALTVAGRNDGVPSQPQNFEVVRFDGGATLTWTAPNRLPGALLRYEISIDSGATWLDVGKVTDYKYMGLDNSAQYNFAVRAINDVKTAAVYDNETFALIDRGSGRGAQAMVLVIPASVVKITDENGNPAPSMITAKRNSTIALGTALNNGQPSAVANIVWSVSDPTFAIVDADGNVTTLNKMGVVTLLAKDTLTGITTAIVLRIT
jgi:hypothetical protein